MWASAAASRVKHPEPGDDEPLMSTLLEEETRTDYFEIPVIGLSGQGEVPFALFLATSEHKRVLYQPPDNEFGGDCEVRLRSEGVDRLYIRAQDRGDYARRVEDNLDLILKDRSLAIDKRAEVLQDVALQIADDLFVSELDPEVVFRARRVMAGTASLILRDQAAFKAIRTVLGASEQLAEHSMTVAMLSIGLAYEVLGRDPNTLMHAGLSGLLHDIGHAGASSREHDQSDPDHPRRGYQMLVSQGLPEEVSQVALCHHERFDGSGFPRGLSAGRIPMMARIVGLVDTFHRVYGDQQDAGPAATFETLRILAQVYRGCFDPRLTGSFVQLFAY